MIGVPVDMADIATFDLGLLATLDQHASTIRDYMKTAHDCESACNIDPVRG